MKNTFFLLLSFLSVASSAAQKSYFEYHTQINLTEKMMFVDNNVKGGLAQYESVFSAYDFVYAGDCIIAVQMAIYGADKTRFQYFVRRAFENGVSWKHLRGIPYIAKSDFFTRDSAILKSYYPNARKKYLSRIDTEALKEMYHIFYDDQLNKNLLKEGTETHQAFVERYRPVFANLIGRVNKLISRIGLPMERNLGLTQQNIMSELKLDCPDLLDIYYRNKNSCRTILVKDQFVVDEWNFASNYYLTIIVHQQNILDQFDSSLLRSQIGLGNIHPKDVAFLLFNFYRDHKTPVGIQRPQFLVGFNQDRLKPNCGPVPDSVVNTYRVPLYLPPIEQDRAKWKFMQDQGMYFIWGYCGFRA